MTKHNTWTALRWSLFGLMLLAAGAATVLGWRFVFDKRAAVHAAAQERERVPEVAARQAALEAEVEKRARDVERVEAFIITKEQLARLVGEIEDVGRELSVQVSIPTVEEKQLLNDQGAPTPPTGPLVDVRLKIVAVGSPKKLLSFLHALEHMQKLVYFESWRLDASEQVARNRAAEQTGDGVPALSERAQLTADMIVAVRRSGGETL